MIQGETMDNHRTKELAQKLRLIHKFLAWFGLVSTSVLCFRDFRGFYLIFPAMFLVYIIYLYRYGGPLKS